MKMHCYFLLNVKHGASQLYLGGGLQLSSAGTVRAVFIRESVVKPDSVIMLNQDRQQLKEMAGHAGISRSSPEIRYFPSHCYYYKDYFIINIPTEVSLGLLL